VRRARVGAAMNGSRRSVCGADWAPAVAVLRLCSPTEVSCRIGEATVGGVSLAVCFLAQPTTTSAIARDIPSSAANGGVGEPRRLRASRTFPSSPYRRPIAPSLGIYRRAHRACRRSAAPRSRREPKPPPTVCSPPIRRRSVGNINPRTATSRAQSAPQTAPSDPLIAAHPSAPRHMPPLRRERFLRAPGRGLDSNDALLGHRERRDTWTGRRALRGNDGPLIPAAAP